MPIDPDDLSAAHETAKRAAKFITGDDVAGFAKVLVFIVLPFVLLITFIGAVVYGVF